MSTPTESGASSFYWAMRLMPRARRDAMFALYRYCRAIDDVADGPDEPARKLAVLAEWRRDLERLRTRGRPRIREVRSLAGPIAAFDLPHEPLVELVAGMEMDARGDMVGPDLPTLRLYCARVAGAVGLLSVRIFGAEGEAADRFAIALGEALQLTNILRDLEEDAARERLYLPREHLAVAGIDAEGPAAALRHPRLPDACEATAALAETAFRAALASVPADPRPLRPAMVMLATYLRLLGRLRGAGWRLPRPPIGVAPGERLWIAIRHMGPPATWPRCT